MLKRNCLYFFMLLSLIFVSCEDGNNTTIELTSNDVLIEGIAYPEMFNKVLLNVINNYYDGEGSNLSKSNSTGVWLGDHQGDSGIYAPEILFALAADERLLPNRSATDRVRLTEKLQAIADRTLNYSLYALGEFDQYINGGIFPPSNGEMSAAMGGLIGLSAGYIWESDPGLKNTFYETALQFTDLANAFLNGDPELEPLGDLLASLYYSPILVGGMSAYNMSRFAEANKDTPTYDQDVALVGQTLTILDTHFWNEAANRYEYEGGVARYTFDHPASTLGHAKYYQLTKNEQNLSKAIQLGDLSHDSKDVANLTALSNHTNTSISYLALYEATGEVKYLQWVAAHLDAVEERLLVEDPYYPGYLIAGHDEGRIRPIINGEGWPDYVEGQHYSNYPGCTGCNNQLCFVIYLYDYHTRQL